MSHSGPSQRQLRVGEELRHILVETLQRGHFQHPILFESAAKITVSEVRISPDLKNATAYVSVLGGGNMGDIITALNEAASYFQREVGHSMKMRNTPRIRFVEDDSFANAAKIESILKNIKKQEA